MASGAHSAGEQIGSYRILRRLGSGGMGEVFLADDTLLNRRVALKFLASVSADEKYSQSLLNEARAASRLDHPNIGIIFGLERTASGQPFIVMAYYEGQTLGERILTGPLSAQEATDIARQTACGLEAAHTQRIVHRDIKPSNLILTHDGTVKIVDFGIAKAIRATDSTQTMGISGTIAYLSPEQAQGFAVDQRSDLWSVGVLLIEMLTAKPVFVRDSDPATLYAIVHTPPPALSDEVPLPLQSVIYRALAKSPDARYQSAAEMVQDLSAATAAVSRRKVSLYRRLAAGTAQTNTATVGILTKLAIGLAVLIAAALAVLIPWRERLLTDTPSPHIAILPGSASGDDQALADGFLETVSSRLSDFQSENPNLWIVPISEIRRRKVSDPTVARKVLNASLVITCGIRHQGHDIHLLLNLIDTKDLRQLGSGELSGSSDDLSGLEDEAVQRIATLAHLKRPSGSLNDSPQSSSFYQPYLQAIGYIQRYDQAGNVDRAISLLRQVTAADPKFALAFSWLGEAYRTKYVLTKETQWLSLAEASVNHALELNGSLASIHMIMGRVQLNLGRLDLALSEYQRAVQSEPRNADAIIGLAEVYSTDGHLAEAETMYRRAAALRPDYWQGFNSLGLFLKHQRRYPEAIEQFKRVIQLTPDNFAGYSNLAATYIDAGRLNEAEAPLTKSAELSPSYPVLANLGVLYTKQHKYKQAAATTERALQLNARNWEVWESLGTIYLWLGDTRKAKTAFQKSLPLLDSDFAIQSPQPETLAEYAEMLALCGEKPKARQQYEVALAMAPNDTSVLLSGASVYSALGETKRAVDLANKAVAKGLTLEEFLQNPSVQWLRNTPKFKSPAS